MKNFVTSHFNRVFSGLEKLTFITKTASNRGYKDKTLIKILNDYRVYQKNCLDIGPGTGRWINF